MAFNLQSLNLFNLLRDRAAALQQRIPESVTEPAQTFIDILKERPTSLSGRLKTAFQQPRLQMEVGNIGIEMAREALVKGLRKTPAEKVKFTIPSEATTTVGRGVASAFGPMGMLLGSQLNLPEAQIKGPEAGAELALLALPLGKGKKVQTGAKLAKEAGIFKGFTDLTTKTLQKLKGRSTVSKQFIRDLTNTPDLKQPERDLIRKLLDDFNDKVPVKEFANKVKTELLPVKTMGKPTIPKYETISLPDELRGPVANYSEHIYQSPIRNSAGNTHFSAQEFPNYFAHVRVEDVANVPPRAAMGRGGLVDRKTGEVIEAFQSTDRYKQLAKQFDTPGDTRRILELQSDLFQKGGLKSEVEFATRPGTIYPNVERTPIEELQKLEPYRNTWHERIIKEELKRAAKDNKTKLQLPRGETAMKIEGLGEAQQAWAIEKGTRRVIPEISDLKTGLKIIDDRTGQDWIITDVLGAGRFQAIPKDKLIQMQRPDTRLGSALREEGFERLSDLPEARRNKFIKDQTSGFTETFDISGKIDTNNPIFRFYEKEVGRFVTNKFNAKQVTDPQGVKWWEIPVLKSIAKLPIEAFSALPFAPILDFMRRRGES